MTLGQNIRAAREAAGLTQIQLAERVSGLTQPTLSEYETGVSEPRLATLQRIAAALRVDYRSLLPQASG